MGRPARGGEGETARLATLFAVLYFVPGIGDPAAGLLAQPVRSLLNAAGEGAASMIQFDLAARACPVLAKTLCWAVVLLIARGALEELAERIERIVDIAAGGRCHACSGALELIAPRGHSCARTGIVA